jgi:hypothetical protein
MNNLFKVTFSNGGTYDDFDEITYIITAPDGVTAVKMVEEKCKSLGYEHYESIVEIPWPDRNIAQILW